jgi:branched-chain amino acid transport system substrate-binding protein
METRRAKRFGVPFSMILGLAGCVLISTSMVFAASPKEILIGHLHPLTGGAAHIGQQFQRAMNYAVDEINSTGGIKSMDGAKIKLLPADHQGKLDVGIAETERLARQGVSLIVGAYYSSVGLVATQQAERLKVPFLVDIGVADEITERGLKYTFRFGAPTRTVMSDGLKYVMEIAKANHAVPKTVAVIYENSAYGQSIIRFAKEAFTKLGVQVVADIPYDRKGVDFSTEVRKIKALNPDTIGNTSYPADGLLLLRTMKEQGLRPMAILGLLDAFYTDTKTYREGLGDYALYNYMMRIYGLQHSDPRYKSMETGFKQRFREGVDSSVEWAYQCTYIVKEVLELAASSDREKIREAFTKLMYKDHLSASEQPIRFGPDGQNAGATSTLLQQHPEGDRVVYPAKFAETKAVWPHPAWKRK